MTRYTMIKFAKAMFLFLGLSVLTQGKENIGQHRMAAPDAGSHKVFAGCTPSKGRADLDINNVRTPIYINGDMWWDLVGNAEYEVPYGSGKHSLFSGAIWVGGLDNQGNLKMAAQTYRQSGSDFWPGPLDTTNATITNDVCQKYDKHWKITKAEVADFVNYFNAHSGDLDGYDVPDAIKTWPGNGDATLFQGKYLAPFEDIDSNGVYDYQSGDYPRFNLSSTEQRCGEYLLGDQTIWWVFNDAGNTHSETGSRYNIGVEIQAQAFGFNTNDEINNMTFYKYKIINRASTILNNTYFGSWVDADLGNAFDDYVGCDVKRGFGYCYNGDADDDGATGYGFNPPAIGMDFFEGPIADDSDHVDNDRDSVIDEAGEQIIMSKFVYYNNDFSNIGNPSTDLHYYNYLRGIWKDGSKLLYGGNGYQSGGDSCDFMFPGETDPAGWGTHGVTGLFQWSENYPKPGDPPNQPDDRRFLQSAGSFTLQPGAVNFITTGAVWARTSSGGPLASVKLLRLADDKAQILFDNCFKIVDGPDAPKLTIRELDRELIMSLSNLPSSNNYKELYKEKDPAVTSTLSYFTFEGYKVYQVVSPDVTTNDLKNADKARLVFQCDIKNGVAQIVNQYFQPDMNAFAPVEEVNGEDNGLRHTFRVTTDAFSSGDPTLVNHKTYYFLAIAYAYNADEATFDPYVEGLSAPYLAGRRGATGTGIEVYTAIPHISTPESEGLVLSTFYGDGPEITRVTGLGNGYNIGSDRGTLDLKQDQVNEIIFNQGKSKIDFPTYQAARGPVDIRIYDPMKVVPGNFELWLTDTATSTGNWRLKNMNTGQTDNSIKTLEFPYDQLFENYGFYVSINQVKAPGEYPAGGNGFIEASVTYSDPNSRWLGGVPDIDGDEQLNWIRSGSCDATPCPDWDGIDDPEVYERILGGTWAPFRVVNNDGTADKLAPASSVEPASTGKLSQELDSLRFLDGIDVVITNDKSKWSRCVVFEMNYRFQDAEGKALKNLLRRHPSMNIDGTYSTTDSGYSWFPGYAMDVETGERLNIAFGEDSYITPDNGYIGETGGDMKFNPTSTYFYPTDTNATPRVIAGGKHFLYVFGRKNVHNVVNPTDTSYWGPAYDGCEHLHSKLWKLQRPNATTLTNAEKVTLTEVWKDCMWVSIPMAVPAQSWLSSDAKIRLRMTHPYRTFTNDSTANGNDYKPYYRFSTDSKVGLVKQTEVAKSALDIINIVPNPYYAYSGYEQNQLDNRVKIVNLPPKCTVRIYSPAGVLIRTYKRDAPLDNSSGSTFPESNSSTSIDWDLKNSVGVPIASGMYIIHIDAPGVGERTIKWFGAMRPIDLDTF